MFANLPLNLGFVHLLGTLLSLANLATFEISFSFSFSLKPDFVSKPSNLTFHSLISLVDLHFLKL
jgi:hypothetical protein